MSSVPEVQVPREGIRSGDTPERADPSEGHVARDRCGAREGVVHKRGVAKPERQRGGGSRAYGLYQGI